MIKEKFKKVLEAIKENKLKFVIFYFAYLGISIILNKTFISIEYLINYSSTIFQISFFIMNFLLIPLVVSITLILAIIKIKELKAISVTKSSVPVVAMIATFFGGTCPGGCFVGLVPAFVGLSGASITISRFPLHGLEIQIISLIVLIISIGYLTRETLCKVNYKKV